MSIEQYEWSSPDIEACQVTGKDANVVLDLGEWSGVSVSVPITRNDTIALAKHFGLTEEDLRDE